MQTHQRLQEKGGITILVALMLLTLLTVTAIGMSRGSLRETMFLAAARQSHDIREVADSGVEWAIEWMDPKIWPDEFEKGASANPLVAKAMSVVKDETLMGTIMEVSSAKSADRMVFPARTGDVSGIERKFDAQLSYMGRLPITDVSVMDKRIYPLLWMVRARGQVTLPGGMKFRHDREAWISTPLPEVRQ